MMLHTIRKDRQSSKQKGLNLGGNKATLEYRGERTRAREIGTRRLVVAFIISVVILSVLRISSRRASDTSVLEEGARGRVAHRTKNSKVGDVLGADRFGR
jgi:hypothetical protein